MDKFKEFLSLFFKFKEAKHKNCNKTTAPKISVIIPCYNAEKYIDNINKMLQEQIFKDFEVIFVNDGSIDNTEKFLRKLEDSRYSLINLTTNLGAGAARNIGLSQAKGDYIIFLDADDFYFPNLLSESYTKAIKTNADITMFKTICFDDNTGSYINEDVRWLWSPPFPINKKFSPNEVKNNLFTFCRGAVWNKLYKKSFITQNHLYFLNTKRNSDSFFVYASYVCAKNMYIMDYTLLAYRINCKTSITSTTEGYNEGKLKAIESLKKLLKQKGVLKKYAKALKEYEDTF